MLSVNWYSARYFVVVVINRTGKTILDRITENITILSFLMVDISSKQ